ncbi:MAG TPA: hypothetical protein VGM67_14755 [Gemmatimonadaceae bacterium]|jgi:hypothetical protein
MSPWLVALVAGIVVALIQYGWRDLRDRRDLLPAAMLRTGAVMLLVALFLDAPIARPTPTAAWTALDASQSMARDDSAVWRAARDSARATRSESTFVFGDSVRRSGTTDSPSDKSSNLRLAVDRALAAGHPLTVVTDGEVDDPDAARTLPPGSRVVVIPRSKQRDLALATIEGPRAVISGDTVNVRIGVSAGSAGAHAGTLVLSLNDKTITTARVDSLGPFGERTIDVSTRLDGPAGPSALRAIVSSPDDAEARNDTLVAAIDLSRAASAVFASTSPDFDARYSLAVLRGALAIPTRGYFRVAPGEWRLDGPLTPVPEETVRNALRDAPVAIIHGDTAAFGPPRAATLGPLALLVTTGTDGEWYPSAAPPSPLAPALSGMVWDSLPPIGLAANPPKGEWTGLEARLARGPETQAAVVGSEQPRRVVIVAASGLWRWQFRGGVSSDAFTALWGSIFDWLAAERADRRAVVPDDRLLRAGDPVRWRRGSASDSIVPVVLRARGSTRADSLTLRFTGAANIVESPPLAAGLYDVTTRGGTSLLAVNSSREWLPRVPRLSNLTVRGSASSSAPPRLRDAGWVYALAILMLCAEWIVRRRRGMR